MKYDIIIPHYGVNERVQNLARRCLETIRENSKDYALIFIDNGGGELLKDELSLHHGIVMSSGKNLGFVRAINAGFKLSTAPYIVLLNNDAEAVPGWLEKLSIPLVDKVGMSGPLTTTKESWQGNVPEGFAEYHVLSRKSMLAFFCVMFRRDLVDTVGLLDEDFGVGFGDDDNYCERAHRAGYELVLVTTLTIPHNHRTTFRALYSLEDIQQKQDVAMRMHFEKMQCNKERLDGVRVLNIGKSAIGEW